MCPGGAVWSLPIYELVLMTAFRVAVRPEVFDRAGACHVQALAAVAIADVERGTVQIVGRVVGAEVGAVPEDRAVLHQPVAQEQLLSRLHVRSGEDLAAARVDYPHRDRRLRLVAAVGEQPEHEEPEKGRSATACTQPREMSSGLRSSGTLIATDLASRP